jgi:hypothetical protein
MNEMDMSDMMSGKQGAGGQMNQDMSDIIPGQQEGMEIGGKQPEKDKKHDRGEEEEIDEPESKKQKTQEGGQDKDFEKILEGTDIKESIANSGKVEGMSGAEIQEDKSGSRG